MVVWVIIYSTLRSTCAGGGGGGQNSLEKKGCDTVTRIAARIHGLFCQLKTVSELKQNDVVAWPINTHSGDWCPLYDDNLSTFTNGKFCSFTSSFFCPIYKHHVHFPIHFSKKSWHWSVGSEVALIGSYLFESPLKISKCTNQQCQNEWKAQGRKASTHTIQHALVELFRFHGL